jgi:cytochrome oxidase assembly protein ShyY1
LFSLLLRRFYCAASISVITVLLSARTIQKIKKLATALAVLALAAIFFSLGLWQLDRARELSASEKATPVQDQRIYNLNDLTSSQGSLPVAAFGKSVSTSGHYIANFKAPNQVSADGSVADWEVALVQVDTASAILVVRGLWSDRITEPAIVMANVVDITGVIYPSQYEDRAPNTPSQLSRLDSSLLTSTSEYQLYDGFISATSEVTRSGEVNRPRIQVALSKSGVPGYYWQHISYVVIWWFMVALVLWAPFYKGRDEEPIAS